MIDQLIARLEPQRRHLTYLVGLLVLTFVLASVLAWRAHLSEKKRIASGFAELTSVAEQGADTWAKHVEGAFGAAADGMLRSWPATLLNEPHAPLDLLSKRVILHDACPDCAGQVTTTTFSVNLADNTTQLNGALSAAALKEMVKRSRAGQFALANDSVGRALYFINDNGAVRAAIAFVRFDDDAVPVRLAGLVLAEASTRTMLSTVFEGVALRATGEAGNAELYTAQMTVDGATLLRHAEPVEVVARVTSASPPSGRTMTFGGVFEVGVRPNAYSIVSPATQKTASAALPILLLGIMVLILTMSLLMIRREEELVRLRAEFISSVSHELRTPLAQIRMFTETLLLGRVRSDVERRRSLEIIDQEARRLSSLVENVLLFSKSEGGVKPRLTPQATPLASEIRRAVEGFGPMLRQHSADIRTELQENLIAAVDRDALRQIMINLIDNALKYGPTGQRVMVGTAMFDSDARIWVDDEGPGIPGADRERVFDSFVRLRRDVDAQAAGSGIGLAVVRELAKLHGGECWAEAAPGGGARIVVQFPDAYLRTEQAANLSVAS